MQRALPLVSALAIAVFLASYAWLGRLERLGPPRSDLVLEGGIPATLYLPGRGSSLSAFLDPPPPDARAPVVVVAHGFAGDRVAMSSPARRLAESGYAALTLDLRGHGQNRNPFTRSLAMPGYFAPDLAAAVDFLRTSPHVDGSRIAVMGHSMGAGAALDYGTRDSGIDAVVMMSGGWQLAGPYRPPNALFIYAARDPRPIRDRSDALAARLAGAPRIERSHTHGDPARGTAVRVVEIPGVDHASIVWADAASREIIAWLDGVFGIERRPGETTGASRAVPIALIAVALLFAMPGVGAAVGRLLPASAPLPAEGRPMALLTLALALALAMPLLATGAPGAILSLEVADVVISHFALAGLALLAVLALRGDVAFGPLFRGIGPALPGAAAAMIAVYLLLSPLGTVLHRLALTPERLLAFGLAAFALAPFALASALLLRRGGPLSASLYAVGGRAIAVALLLVGVWIGVLDRVVLFMVGPIVAILLFVELLAAAIYTTSRNLVAIAMIDAGALALILAAIMPIRI